MLGMCTQKFVSISAVGQNFCYIHIPKFFCNLKIDFSLKSRLFLFCSDEFYIKSLNNKCIASNNVQNYVNYSPLVYHRLA